MMTIMNLKIDQSIEKSMALGVSTNASGVIPTKPRIGFAPATMHTQTKFSKQNFSTFNGENPTGWVYKCERVFKYDEVPEQEKVGIASIHLEGKALD